MKKVLYIVFSIFSFKFVHFIAFDLSASAITNHYISSDFAKINEEEQSKVLGQKQRRHDRVKSKFFTLTEQIDLKSYYHKDAVIRICPETNLILRDDVKKFFVFFAQNDLENSISLLHSLSPNDLSFILLFQFYLVFSKRDHSLVQHILDHCSLEFNKEVFLVLSLDHKRCFLKNLCLPIKMATSCFNEWVHEKYLLSSVKTYDSLSPVGVAYFLLLVLHSFTNIPEIAQDQSYYSRAEDTIASIMVDIRFPLDFYDSDSKFLLYQNFVDQFSHKYYSFE